jgi:uroporphyrinogen-III synthase
MQVLVTRPQAEASRWADDLRCRGFDPVALPLIAIVPHPQQQALQDAWTQIHRFRAVMFVSGNAVRHFFAQRPATACWPNHTRAWAPGVGTAAALVEAGVAPALVDAPSPQAAQFDSETLWQRVASQVGAGDRVLIVRGEETDAKGAARDWLAEQLGAAGVEVQAVAAYLRTAPVLSQAQRTCALLGATEGVWLFSSSQGIANLRVLLPEQDWSRARALATHPRIAQAARLAGFGVVVESRPSFDSVAAALESFR